MHLPDDHIGSHSHDHHHHHDHSHDCEHTPMEELLALMKYMTGHNAAHARELAELAVQLDRAGQHEAYHQVMHAVEDFEKGNLRLSAVLAALEDK